MDDAVFYACALVLVILFGGDPDLMDALIVYLGAGCTP